MTERHVELDGCLNFRDIGGYTTASGRIVRRGCLFRSGELCSLSDGDLGTIARLGIKVVVDLRNHGERSGRPSRLPVGVELIERTSPSSSRVPDKSLEEQIMLGDLPDKDDAYMTRVYIDFLERLGPEIRLIIERSIDAVQRPLLFHCAAGKDRTGIAAAILLGLLGVADETILEDYTLTTTYYAGRRLEGVSGLLADHGLSPDAVRHLVEARTPALDAALRHLHETWGSYDAYATSVLGVAPELPSRLRGRLTE